MSSPAHARGHVPIEVLQLAERGARLFPLAPHSKRPLVTNWQDKNNTSDPLLLEDIVRQVPDCNWAIVCGPASGVFALDYDCKTSGKNGLVWYQHNLEQHGVEWADTRRVRTPTLGLHDHFLWPSGFEVGNDNTGRLAPGVDIKGLGGYVVVPPSEVGGRRYYFEDCDGEKDVLEAPSWLLDELRRVFASPPPREEPGPRTWTGRKFGEHERHNVLKSEAGRLANARISYNGLLAHFRQINRESFFPPYPDSELIRQAKDMHYRWAPKDSRLTPDVSSELVLQPFSEIQQEPIEWEWPPYLPRGSMTLLTGEP